ncbi:peptide deformylase [Cyanobium sp. Morenito 9A2]|uniref:peptide deformylase n=1 Tax=Cyanobium sp. Morenito 9A2 TaxID=2823718 RepID=UPI0020CCA6F9|nr:peptide deformylase [Cyanobium sp. Morenito 9A2]MCP9848360.1 peptide deformylase [Cyanobium sp. Morenito 9A2]
MAVRTILLEGDPRLRRLAEPVLAFPSAAIDALIDDLRDTMAAAEGAGLAAPQIDVNLRVVIFGITVNRRYPQAPPIPETVLINPVITPLGAERDCREEGCLSVPDRRAPVSRWARIRYQGCDGQGRLIEREVEGFHARVVQHEVDHLDGVLFPDHLGASA